MWAFWSSWSSWGNGGSYEPGRAARLPLDAGRASASRQESVRSFATILLGVLIFIDDYFNCLTVGSVMRPVTDKHNVSRAKPAYLIDATAAPVCIIAPISSWAAAVSGFVEGEDGLSILFARFPLTFMRCLPLS